MDGEICAVSIVRAKERMDGWTHSLCKVTAGMLRLFRYRLAEFTPHSKELRYVSHARYTSARV